VSRRTRIAQRRYSEERVRLALRAMHETGFGRMSRAEQAVILSYERGVSPCGT